MGQKESAGKDVPVVVLRKELPGLKIRMLADRDAGEIRWETFLVDEDGYFRRMDDKRLCVEELVHLDEVIDLLREAVRALTPRRRLDLTRLDPPIPPSSEGS